MTWVTIVSADVPGTRPAQYRKGRDSAPGSTALEAVVTETGRISVSVDGVGTLGESATVQVEKPTGASVRSAFLAATSAGFSDYSIEDGAITLDGAPITWTTAIPTVFSSYNYFTEVTALVATKLDSARTGLVTFAIREAEPMEVDGVALVVVFDDPTRTDEVSVVLFFGAQNPAGDAFSVGLAEPIDASDPNLWIDLCLGISYSYQSADVSDQFSVVDVNGARVTSAAGGQDDGAGETGALFTIGGIDDSTENPFPYSLPLDFDGDDERYNLAPFVADGDTRIAVETTNPSADDNLFFACLSTSETVAVSEALFLAPNESRGAINSIHTVTATFQDASGAGISGADVTFDIFAGPHVGTSSAATTGSDGMAEFHYTGTTVGVDSIIARTNTGATEFMSNVVTRTWDEEGNGGEGVVLTLGPTTSQGEIGTLYTMTATLMSDGSPSAGVEIAFEISFGPNSGLADTSTTTSDGMAQFLYTSAVTGVDSIVARTVSAGSPPATSNTAAREWTDQDGADIYALRLSPPHAVRPVGAEHRLTATLTVGGQPVQSESIEFVVFDGPHAGTGGADISDVNGQVMFDYTGAIAGIDSIVATAEEARGGSVTSNVATVQWTGDGSDGVTVALRPVADSIEVGEPHAVTATVLTNGLPTAEVRVEFSVIAGPQAGVSGTDTSGVSGEATFMYVGSVVGVDTVRAVAVVGGELVPSNTVTAEWLEDDDPGGGGGVEVGLDIKPTSCVNPINTGSRGITPAALLGSDSVDVRDIDVATLELEGVAPLRHHFKDVSRPGDDVECGCSPEGRDGHLDLTLKFDTQALVAALGPVTDREERAVTLVGRFEDGEDLRATDCILIIHNGDDQDDDADDGAGDDSEGEPDNGEEEEEGSFGLDPAAPNPFNPHTSISYRVATDGHVRLTIYDVRGRAVAKLVDGFREAGGHTEAWTAGNLAGGFYLCRLQSGRRSAVQRIIILK